MTRMYISERTLSPVFMDDGPEEEPYAGCDWEPYCLTHDDDCDLDRPDCIEPPVEHPRCDGLI